MLGNLEGASGSGPVGLNNKERAFCVQSDGRASDIAGDWEAMAFEARVWNETVAEWGAEFYRRVEEGKEDATKFAGGRERQTRLGELLWGRPY